jgi:hypothetical protein
MLVRAAKGLELKEITGKWRASWLRLQAASNPWVRLPDNIDEMEKEESVENIAASMMKKWQQRYGRLDDPGLQRSLKQVDELVRRMDGQRRKRKT